MLWVIVLYKQKLEESKTYQSLLHYAELNDTEKPLSIFIYDNSPKVMYEPLDDFLHQKHLIQYQWDRENSGLAKAYNSGVKWAKKHNQLYLVLLDQDTNLTASYIEKVLKIQIDDTERVVVPLIKEGEIQLSPHIGKASVAPGYYEDDAVVAINSGTIVPISVVEKIGGFTTEFPLDYLDHWFFYQVRRNNIPVEVIEETLQHSLSVTNLEDVSDARLESILTSEKRFILNYQPDQKVKYNAHYLLRMIKYLLRTPNKLKIGFKVWRKKV